MGGSAKKASGSSGKSLSLGGGGGGGKGAVPTSQEGWWKKTGWISIPELVKKTGTTKTKDYGIPKRPDVFKYEAPEQRRISQGVIDRARTNVGGVNLNKQGLEALRAQALGNSAESPWLKLQLEQLEKQKGFDIDELGAASAGREAQARASLASKGGLSGGAAERLAGSSARQQMMDRQGLNREAMMGRLGLATTAEEQKQDTLRNLPGMETQAAQFDLGKQQYLSDMEFQKEQVDLNAAMAEAARKGDVEMARYYERMKDYAAAKQAQAIQEGGERRGGWTGMLFS